MKRPYWRRAAPNIDRTIYTAMVRLNDELRAIIACQDKLPLADILKLCDIIKAMVALQKIMPKLKKQTNDKGKQLSMDDL